MSRLEKRIAPLEAAQTEQHSAGGTPEDCCAAFGYTLEQAIAEFGSFPVFAYEMMICPDADHSAPEGDALELYRAACR